MFRILEEGIARAGILSGPEAPEAMAGWLRFSAILALALFSLLAGLLFWCRGLSRRLDFRAVTLRQIRRRYRLLFDRALSGLCIVEVLRDSKGRPEDFVFLQVNSAFERHAGFREGDVRGRRATDLDPGFRESGLVEAFGRVARTGEPACLELRLPMTRRLIRMEIYRVESGRCAGAFVDITEKREGEAIFRAQWNIAQALASATRIEPLMREVSKRLAGLPFVAAGGIYRVSETDRSLVLAAHWGLSPEFLERHRRVGLDAGQGRLVAAGRTLFLDCAAAPPGSEEARHHRALGLRALAVVPLVHEGLPVGCLNLASTETGEFPESLKAAIQALGHQIANTLVRLRAEERLGRSETDYRMLAEKIQDGMAIVDDGGQILYANPEARTLLGYSQDPLGGLALESVLPPDELPRIQAFQAARREGQSVPKSYETRLLHRDGRILFVSVSANRTVWQGREHTVAVFRDITQRRRMEREILKIQEHERSRIARDLHDSLGQQLTGIGYMAGTLGHRLRERAPGEVFLADRMGHEIRKTIAMTRQIAMNLSGIHSAEGGLLAAMDRMAANLRTVTGTEIRAEGGPVPAADRPETAGHLYQIAAEAVTNAIRHGNPGRVILRLGSRNGVGELAVEDDGAGWTGTDGRGMGLNIMRYRANQIGATLDIEPAVPSGTRVVCRFPL